MNKRSQTFHNPTIFVEFQEVPIGFNIYIYIEKEFFANSYLFGCAQVSKICRR